MGVAYKQNRVNWDKMLKSLEIKNFTVFEEAKLEFSAGLNVIIGENSTGKTQLLKLGYAAFEINSQKMPSMKPVQSARDLLWNIFAVETPSNLIRFGQSLALVSGVLNNKKFSLELSAENASHDSANLEPNGAIFLPTREMLSIYEGFASALRNRELAFDSTFLDLADALGLTHLKGEKLEQVKPFIATLEKHMGGKVILERGRFYLDNGKRRLEMSLVAEGIRKLAMLAHLLANGSIQKGVSVFWDEPESNLNPKLMQHLADILVQLANFGVQICIATHSLFFLRELEIQLALHPATPARFIGLTLEKKGISVMQGNSFLDIDPVAALDADIEQSERYLQLV
jgi:AAA15 family ATPase/GTPase